MFKRNTIRVVIFCSVLTGIPLTILIIYLICEHSHRQTIVVNNVTFEFVLKANSDVLEPDLYYCGILDHTAGRRERVWLGSYHGTHYRFVANYNAEHDVFLIESIQRPNRIVLVYRRTDGVLWPSDLDRSTELARSIISLMNSSSPSSPLVLTDINSNK